LDGAGHIGFADWFEAGSDTEALTQARHLKYCAQTCEVWNGKRLVGRFGHMDLTATSLTS
jgi:hypothetical protein